MTELRIGEKAPAFSLLDQNENAVSLEDFRDGPLVVYFYPKADTPGCTKQSCSIRDAMADIRKLGASVVGISPDKPAKQARFDKKYELGFPLLADEDHAVAEAWGAWGRKSLYGKSYTGIIRSAFVVNREGILAGVFYKISPADTVPRVSQILTELA